jgi:hypothetical protein
MQKHHSSRFSSTLSFRGENIIYSSTSKALVIGRTSNSNDQLHHSHSLSLLKRAALYDFSVPLIPPLRTGILHATLKREIRSWQPISIKERFED